MKTFVIAALLLIANSFACFASVFTSNTGLVLPLFVTFFVLYGIVAFTAGRYVRINFNFSVDQYTAPAKRPSSTSSEDQLLKTNESAALKRLRQQGTANNG